MQGINLLFIYGIYLEKQSMLVGICCLYREVLIAVLLELSFIICAVLYFTRQFNKKIKELLPISEGQLANKNISLSQLSKYAIRYFILVFGKPNIRHKKLKKWLKESLNKFIVIIEVWILIKFSYNLKGLLMKIIKNN